MSKPSISPTNPGGEKKRGMKPGKFTRIAMCAFQGLPSRLPRRWPALRVESIRTVAACRALPQLDKRAVIGAAQQPSSLLSGFIKRAARTTQRTARFI